MKIPATEKPGKIKRFRNNYLALCLTSLVLFSTYANAQFVDTTSTHIAILSSGGFTWKFGEFVNGVKTRTDTSIRLAIRDTGTIATFKNTAFIWSVRSGVLRWDTLKSQGGPGGGYSPPGDNTKILVGDGTQQSPSTVKGLLSLNLVDNTSDVNKPVSTAQANAIGTKLGISNNLSDIANAATARTNLGAAAVTNTIQINGGTPQQIGSNPSFTVTAIPGNDASFSVTQTSTTNFNINNGVEQTVHLGYNGAISFSNLRQNSRLTLHIIHDVAGTYFTNFPDKLPGDFAWASGVGEETRIRGVYDSLNTVWKWSFDLYPSLASGGGGSGGRTMYYGSHLMTYDLNQTYPSRKALIDTLMQVEGKNFVWLYSDYYDHSSVDYIAQNRMFMDTAALEGLKVAPGVVGGHYADLAAMIIDLINHPAILKINGRSTFFVYYFTQPNLNNTYSTIIAAGIDTSKLNIVASMLYPQSNGSGGYNQYQGNILESGAANYIYNNYTIQGSVNFAVDKGTSNNATAVAQVITENNIMDTVSRHRGKLAFSGINFDYTSAQNTGYTWQQLAQQLYAILALDTTMRPDGIVETTANDGKERSYMSRTVQMYEELPGLSHIPKLTIHSNIGPNISTFPAATHAGVNGFIKPFINAFLNKQSTITMPAADQVYIKYAMHLRGSPHTTTIPALYSGRSDIDATFWSGTPYTNTPAWSTAGLIPVFDSISVACYLSAPAQIRINSTLSGTTFPAGIAYFSIPIALGTITVDIVRASTNVVHVTASQPVVNETYPGGYSMMEERLY